MKMEINNLKEGGGAVCRDDCEHPDYSYGSFRCLCGKCTVCGNSKHTAIHGPIVGQPAGSQPWGHEFVPLSAGEEQ